ncbi:MAG: hypothetical protein WAN65_22280 [Candidatus Sulfotelmatobacter sp.]
MNAQIFIGSIVLFAALGDATSAIGLWRPGMMALDNAGFASEEQVAASVGNVSTEVVCPSRKFVDDTKRGARLALEKFGTGWRDPGVLSTLLHDALIQIWNQCDTAMGTFGNSVGFVEIYGPESGGSGQRLVVTAQSFIDIVQKWSSVTDVVTQQEQAAVSSRQQAETERVQAEAAAQAQRDRELADEQAAQQKRDSDLASQQFWRRAWDWTKGLAALALFSVWLFKRRPAPMQN